MTEPSKEDIVEKLPPEAREVFLSSWKNLSTEEQISLSNLIKSFPSKTELAKLFVKLAANQLRQTFGQKHNIAIVGPANVGKSTLYNQLISNKSDAVEVSPLPGTTKQNRVADAGLFVIIDTPGADAIGPTGEHERGFALNAAKEADFLIILFDASQGIKKSELEIYKDLISLDKPYIVVYNKIDLVHPHLKKALSLAASSLSLSNDQIIPISASRGDNLNQIILAIAVMQPEMVAALGQAMPQFREQLIWRSIISASSIAAIIALTPLPIIDFAPLVINQTVMVLGIARIHNYKITIERAREIVATFGLGFIARMLFAELSKLGGVPGWILSAAIAAATTVAMGYAASMWFAKGEKVTGVTLNKLTRALTDYLIHALKSLGKNRPSKDKLQKHISKVLENISIEEETAKITNSPLSGKQDGTKY